MGGGRFIVNNKICCSASIKDPAAGIYLSLSY